MNRIFAIYLFFAALGTGASMQFLKDTSLVRQPFPEYGDNLHIEFYPVHGATIAELHTSLLSNGPTDPWGKRRFAYTDWKITWHWPTPRGIHKIREISSDYWVHMRVPSWDPPKGTNPRVIESWNRMMHNLLAHELEHAEHARRNYQRIPEAVRQALLVHPDLTSKQAHAIAFAEMERIRTLDRELDARTDFGVRDGVSLEAVSSPG